jgi:ribonuclease-3
LGTYIFLSRGEEEGGGRKNPTLLANCVEAIIGAIYLDRGEQEVKKFISQYFFPKIPLFASQNLKDAKSLLQEKTQEIEKLTPSYKILKEEGPDHAKIFTVGVFLDKRRLAQAKGRSKQEAEEKAAQGALEKYK